VLTALIDRVDVGVDQIDIHLLPPRLSALLISLRHHCRA